LVGWLFIRLDLLGHTYFHVVYKYLAVIEVLSASVPPSICVPHVVHRLIA